MPNGKPIKKTQQNSRLKKFHKDASPLFHLRKLKTDPNRKAVAVIQSQTLVPVTFSPPQKEIVSRLGPLFESPSPMGPLAAKVVQVEGTPLKTPPNTTWQTPGGTELELSARHSCHSINGLPLAFYSSKKDVPFRSRITEFETETETETVSLSANATVGVIV